ncbi:MAG: hypothetical protein HKO62_04520 [Gammaproteobacteria bacterium]|nr:RimK/LysX family protein [Gammaproteobacteria bacterium]NNL99992.1 hypothetical protein [Gammaproteobacteria bacterium]
MFTNWVKRAVMVVVAVLAVASLMWVGFLAGQSSERRQVLSAVERIEIKEAGISFQARLDSGATVSSINARNFRVPDGDPRDMRANVGKTLHFILENERGETAPVSAEIDQVRGIRTADCRELRYHVYLTVVFRGKEYPLLMNVNDRRRNTDKMLLGRNFLRHGWAVAVLEGV